MAELMKDLIRQCGYTQKQLAEKLEVRECVISKWVNGYHTPSLQQLLALSIVLDISTDDLIESLIATQDERNEKE